MMDENVFECMSVCRVYEYNGNTRLERIADVEDDEIHSPRRSFHETQYFENRTWLHWYDGPSQIDTIGVWQWSASPNYKNVKTDYVQSFFVPDLRPVQVIVIQDVQSMQALVDMLKMGKIRIKPYICNTLFCYESKWGQLDGVLCQIDEFMLQDQCVTLKDTIYLLPCYSLKVSDVYHSEDKNLRFLKKLNMGKPKQYVPFGDINALIQTTISNRMNRTLYKECIGKTKAEWRECKTLFERACEGSLYEEIAGKLGCPVENAQEAVTAFIKRAGELISEGDIDSDVLAQIAINHDALRTQCEATVEQHWKRTHADEVEAAQDEIDKLKNEKETLEAQRQAVLNEVTAAQNKKAELLREIEKYEALGKETVQAVQDKIDAAQKNMAEFIADLSVFMPQKAVENSDSYGLKPASRWTFTYGTAYDAEEDIEMCGNWKETLGLLWDNLKLAGVGPQWSGMLSSFLYSAFLHRMPILLSGPNAEAIASSFSLTVYGKSLDVLKCCGEQDLDAIAEYKKSSLAAVQNPFHPDWIMCIPQTSNNGFTVWLHPFIEDLQIEPRSLYNYVYPVFTECFVDQPPLGEKMLAGRKKEIYAEFQSDEHYRAKMGPIKKLGLSRLIIKRLQTVLADAKCMGAVSDLSMEYLFGLLPLSVLGGKQQLLAELLEEEKNLTAEVKTELQRYIEE